MKKKLIIFFIFFISNTLAYSQSHDGKPCPQIPTVRDADGNSYITVQIGNQCWMRENLRVTQYADGEKIALTHSAYDFTTPYRYAPNDQMENVELYGYLYNWAAASRGLHSRKNPSNVQGICPENWHLPGEDEWMQLIDYVSKQAVNRSNGNVLAIGKAMASDDGWCTSDDEFAVGNDMNTNNLTGFSALPAGNFDGQFVSLGFTADFWSSTVNDYGGATYLYLRSYYPYAALNAYDQRDGRSVRCVHDEENPVQKTEDISAVDTILHAACQGKSCIGDSLVMDADGNLYPTVQIGRQCWMKENLRVTSYDDGTKIRFSKNKRDADICYRYCPMGEDTCVETYGYLYNWAAVMNGAKSSGENPSGVQGICPQGWHVPSRAEWMELDDFVESQLQGNQENTESEGCSALASLCDADYWKSDSYVVKCASSVAKTGFDARPAGLFESYFSDSGDNAYFWSSTSRSRTIAYFFGIGESIPGDAHRYYYSGEGFSVRCLRDE